LSTERIHGRESTSPDRYSQARDELRGWLESGELKSLADEVQGLEAAPEAFVDLLNGGNVGTRIVRLD